MRKTMMAVLAALLAIGFTFSSTGSAEAGWRKRSYSPAARHYGRSYAPRYYGYRRPYYGGRYYGRGYGYYGGCGPYGDCSAGAALGGVVLGALAIAALQAAANSPGAYPYGYAPPSAFIPQGPLPGGAIGVDTNGQAICFGGPDRC